MLLSKVFEVTLSVRNPTNFCADKPRHALLVLQNDYVGRCFGGVYIVGVEKVLEISSCQIARTNNSGRGYVSVRFRAKVSLLSRWDILVGIKVLQRDRILVGEVKGETPAVVNLIATQEVETIQVGQVVAGRVFQTEYSPMQEQPAVVATLLTCERASPTYQVAGVLTAEAARPLIPLVMMIGEALRRRAEIAKTNQAAIWFFEKLLYSYSAGGAAALWATHPTSYPTPIELPMPPAATDAGPAAEPEDLRPAWEGPPMRPLPTGADVRNLLEIVVKAAGGEEQNIAGYWSRPLELYRSSPVAVVSDTPPASPTSLQSGQAVFTQMLKSSLDFLQAVSQMTRVYDTRSELERHANLWAAMQTAQLP